MRKRETPSFLLSSSFGPIWMAVLISAECGREERGGAIAKNCGGSRRRPFPPPTSKNNLYDMLWPLRLLRGGHWSSPHLSNQPLFGCRRRRASVHLREGKEIALARCQNSISERRRPRRLLPATDRDRESINSDSPRQAIIPGRRK